MLLKKTLLAGAMVVLGGFALSASAATGTSTSATFNVQITIQPVCTFAAGAGSNINFGDVPADTATTSALLKSSSNINVTCSKGTPYIVGLATSDGNAGTGHMAGTGSNTDEVPYSLFQDSAYSVVWGNTGTAVATPGNDYLSTGSTAGDGTGLAQTIPVYAQVTDPNFTPDTYTDTVTVSVTF